LCSNAKPKSEKRFAPHPNARAPASHSQQTLNAERETQMTKIAFVAAAFALFAPVAVAILSQAAQIVA
jgi:hypothetical protein